MAKKYIVKEIFGPTLQGEGTYAGSVVNFVRLSFCNRWTGRPQDKAASICSYCDTDFFGGTPLTADGIVASLKALNSPSQTVVISGGEPTMQIDEELVSAMVNAGYRLHLETNGSNPLGPAKKYFTHITMSPKQPLAETKLEGCNDLKILHPPIHPEITHEVFAGFPNTQRWSQAVWTDGGYDAALAAVKDYVMVNPHIRISMQLHKYLGVK
jgi:organic radical activating enzyme